MFTTRMLSPVPAGPKKQDEGGHSEHERRRRKGHEGLGWPAGLAPSPHLMRHETL